jgi:two-component system cell cycle sensor histidine kinase/response regulator CckA
MERTDFEQWRSREVARLLALVETERRYYQEIVAMLPAAVAVLSAANTVAYANRAFRQLFHLRGEELRRLTIGQILPGSDLEERIREVQASGTAPEPIQVQAQDRVYRVSIVPTRNWDDENEIETLLLIETGPAGALAPAPAPAPEPVPPQPALADVPAAIWQADAATLQFTAVNPGAVHLLGFPAEHWLNQPKFFEERILADDAGPVLELYRGTIALGGEASAEFRCLSASGDVVWCRETIRVPAPGAESRTITGVITNVTGRRAMEQQLLAAGRVEALQTLSGRLAHDLNNPLMIATGYAEELRNAMPEDSPQRSDAEEIINATARIAALSGQLNSYARRLGGAAGRVELCQFLTGLQPSIQDSAGMGVQVEIAVPEGRLDATADRETLAEFLVALSSASREGAQDRTRLAIALSRERIAEWIPGATLHPGDYARILLREDGRGLSTGRETAIFETVLADRDPAGVGTMLSRGYALIRQWGGDVSVTSMVGQGTWISIYLPYLEPLPQVAESAEPAQPAPRPEPEPLKEAILVVDDEAGIRGLVRKILKRERYQVLEAGSAEEALAIAVSREAPVDLLLTDVRLPGLSGPELARRLYEASPNLKVLYISGFTDDPSVRAAEYPPGARFLAKPFTLTALLRAVRETLGER